ncbi:MAG: peptidoglycan-binding protein [Parcubacteria group bacterium]|nr:peptidoglycan-binding protein [Parcubacteria group bacterium]
MSRITTWLQTNGLMLATIIILAILAVAFILPPFAQAAMLSQQLDFGMSGSDVTSLQSFLAGNSSIYPEGIISGYFGSLTQAAVSRFQTANNLPAVGRVGPLTLAMINAQMGGGVSSGADLSAPIMNPETISSTSNSATVSWTTSESAKSRVMYGTTWPFLYSTAPSVSTNGYGATASLTIAGLQPNTTYYYVRESIDGPGNIMWTVAKSLATK